MPSKLHEKTSKRINIPSPAKVYVKHSMDILDRIHFLIDKKFHGDYRILAKVLKKEEAEVKNLIYGVKDFPLLTLSELEFAFGEPIISIVKE